jgi:hypothetical protein
MHYKELAVEHTVNPNFNVKTQRNKLIIVAVFLTSLPLLLIPEDEFPRIQ